MDSAKLLIIGGVALGGFYLLNKSKKDRENTQSLTNAQGLILANPQLQTPIVSTVLPNDNLAGFYTPAEANKKALEVVTKWVSMLDAIPKEALFEENKNLLREQVDLQNAFNVTPADINPERFAELEKSRVLFKNSYVIDKTLANYVKRAKQVEFANIYDSLKQAFVNMPKEQVDKLVPLLPKYLFVLNDDFKYFFVYLENNPFTLEEQLFLRDSDVESIFSNKNKDTKVAIGMR